MHTCALVRLQLVVTSYSSGMQSQCNKQIHATHTHTDNLHEAFTMHCSMHSEQFILVTFHHSETFDALHVVLQIKHLTHHV